MLFLVQNGFRVVAHDRRGHGRSSQASSRNDMDGYADDLAAVIEALDLNDATLVGHSTGGGEVARYIGRHGTKRVAKAVLIAAVPPIMVKSATNPEGLPIEVFDDMRSSRMPMKASRPSPRLISPKISRSSMSQPWLCTVRTTRSFPSKTQLRNQPGSSKTRRKSIILARLMASRPHFRIGSTPTCCPS